MATTGVLNGTLMLWYVGGKKVANLITNGFSIDRPTREVANKDSGESVSKKPNRYTWSGTGQAHVEFVDSSVWGASDAKAAIKAGTRILVLSSTGVAGDKADQGYGYLTHFDQDHPDMDNAIYNISIDGDGDLDEITLT